MAESSSSSDISVVQDSLVRAIVRQMGADELAQLLNDCIQPEQLSVVIQKTTALLLKRATNPPAPPASVGSAQSERPVFVLASSSGSVPSVMPSMFPVRNTFGRAATAGGKRGRPESDTDAGGREQAKRLPLVLPLPETLVPAGAECSVQAGSFSPYVRPNAAESKLETSHIETSSSPARSNVFATDSDYSSGSGSHTPALVRRPRGRPRLHFPIQNVGQNNTPEVNHKAPEGVDGSDQQHLGGTKFLIKQTLINSHDADDTVQSETPFPVDVTGPGTSARGQCPECPFYTGSSGPYSSHIKHHTQKTGNYKCRYCSYKADTCAGITKHEVVHGRTPESGLEMATGDALPRILSNSTPSFSRKSGRPLQAPARFTPPPKDRPSSGKKYITKQAARAASVPAQRSNSKKQAEMKARVKAAVKEVFNGSHSFSEEEIPWMIVNNPADSDSE